jgi:uncharacterized integral membrane protein
MLWKRAAIQAKTGRGRTIHGKRGIGQGRSLSLRAEFMKRLLQLVILVPIALISVAFAVANRHAVSVSFDPFSGDMAGGQVAAPLFIILILAVMVGVVIGGSVTWMAQGRHRRALREARSEAARWRSRSEDLQATANKLSPASKGPMAPAPGRLLVHS